MAKNYSLKINFSLIGECFEVLINPDNPSKSKSNLEKKLDCSNFVKIPIRELYFFVNKKHSYE